MIDLHTHILPGVDDGAEDLVEALQMAEEAVKGGVTVVAATPHFFQLPDWGKSKHWQLISKQSWTALGLG